MTDVRILLRAERAARRITHPHASYTTDGKLLCNLCETFVKSEAQWQSHLHSTQHVLRSQRAKDASEVRNGNLKRKAESPAFEEVDEGRKRRALDGEDVGNSDIEGRVGAEVVQNADVEEQVLPEDEVPISNGTQPPPPDTTQRNQASDREQHTPQETTIDEAEFLAFEREIALLDQQNPTQQPSALTAEATISAAPMTAEQLAAQASEEQSTQRGRRDVEVEAEREDAERVLEEEFEMMRGLEERVRVLRERREELRRGSGGEEGDVVGGADAVVGGNVEVVEDGGEEVEDEDDDDDFDDGWGFGGVG